MLTKLIHCQIWILENILTKILHSKFRILRKMLIISHSKFQYCKMCRIICKFKSSATTTDRAGIEGWSLCTDIFSLIKPGCVKMEKKSGAITHRENTVWSVFIFFFFLSCPDLLLVACLFSSLLICLPYCLMKPWLFSSAIFFFIFQNEYFIFSASASCGNLCDTRRCSLSSSGWLLCHAQ